MSYPIPFQFEELEMPESAEAAERCGCPECRAKRLGQEIEQEDEVWNELSLEDDEFTEEVPLLQKVGPRIAAQAGQVAARAKQQIGGLPAEKTCWVQNVLNQAEGESLKPDGIFGPLTRGAVLRFQGRQSLKVDGIVGPQTETALIQTALNTLALASLVPVNGVLDNRTREEIRRFQSQRGLAVDGIVGPITRGAMIDALGGKRCPIRAQPRPRPPTPQPPTPQRPTPSHHRLPRARRQRRPATEQSWPAGSMRASRKRNGA